MIETMIFLLVIFLLISFLRKPKPIKNRTKEILLSYCREHIKNHYPGIKDLRSIEIAHTEKNGNNKIWVVVSLIQGVPRRAAFLFKINNIENGDFYIIDSETELINKFKKKQI